MASADHLPNFLIVGAHKCATTSISNALSRHPDIFVPFNKEPHFFVQSVVRGRVPNCVNNSRRYSHLFQAGATHKWRGEASVLYLPLHEVAIPNLLRELGTETRIIISLRNPVDRAYSAWLDVSRGNRLERLSFKAALVAEGQRRSTAYGSPTMLYRQLGMYASQVEAYLAAFRRVHVVTFDDYVSRPDSCLAAMLNFLDLEHAADVVGARDNEGGRVWRSSLTRGIAQSSGVTMLRRAGKRVSPKAYEMVRSHAQGNALQPVQPMAREIREELTDSYRGDVGRLESLISRDLAGWLRTP